MTIAKADLIEGLAKGLAVLECFGPSRQRLNATLTAQRAGITRAAARRHLLTLAHLGYLESADGYFWLAPKILHFSGSYLASARIPRTVQPELDLLSAHTREAFSAAVLDGSEVVIVARSGAEHAAAQTAPGKRLLAHGLHLGARLPAHATSTGQVLLAGMARSAFNRWLKGSSLRQLTPATLTSPAALRKAIEAVRQQDYCIARETHEPGVVALAVPVRDGQGDVVAALNVVGAANRFSSEALRDSFYPLMRDAATRLRALL